jgi:hypothetical protein
MKGNLLYLFISGLILTVFFQSGALSFSVQASEPAQYSHSNINLSQRNNELTATFEVTITVRNINMAVRSAALVKLYNSDYSLLVGTFTTNTLGQVVFSGLSNGTYNYDVSYSPLTISPLSNNTEFWGSDQAAINGSSQSVSFTRNQPYISIEPTFIPATLKPGQQTSGSFTVKNALTYSTDSYIAIWTDLNKVGLSDYNQLSSPNSISTSSTAAFPFTFTPEFSGTYYYYAFVYSKVNGSYVITDHYSWTQAFIVNDFLGNISINLSDHNNMKAAASNKIVRYDLSNILLDSKPTDANGQASWTSIPAGTYHFDGYNTTLNSVWGEDLYWGQSQGAVTSGTTNAVDIIQSEPYIENIAINGTVFGPGSTVHVDVTVKNPNSVAKTCKAEIRIDKDKISTYDFDSGFIGSLTIQPGQTSIFGFDYTIPLNTLPGTFYIAARIQTLYNAAYLSTDATNWDYSIRNENTTISQIQWSGYTWNVKSGSGLGPGPNDWLANTSGVWIDSNDNLHLKIRKIGTKWYCTEVSSLQSFGYGEYTFQLATNVEKLDKNIVLGLFTYETDSKEIDIEFSRWNNLLNQMGGYVVQPTSITNHKNFPLNLSDNYSTHKFQWSPSEIYFQSYYGNFPNLPDQQHLISDWKYTGSQIPAVGKDLLNLNLWLYKGVVPSDLKEAEVIIKSFTFKKIGKLFVQVQNTDNTSSPEPGSSGVVKLYNSQNVLIDTQTTNQSGTVTFSGIPEGTGYYYQVFYTPAISASIYGQEYWGTSANIQINPIQTTNSIFKRNQPITGTVRVYNGLTDVTGKLVEPATQLRIEQQIINPASIGQSATGSINLDIDKIEPYDFQLTNTSFIPIPANNIATKSWTITPTNKGTYYFSQGVQALLNNIPQISDGSSWSTLPLFEVKPANKPPVANAGAVQSVNEGTLVTLNGTASSDPDNNSLTYLWTAPFGITLSSTTTPKPTFTAPEVKKDSILNFSLTVNDGLINSLPSTVKISVMNVIKTSSHIVPGDRLKIYPNPTNGLITIEGLPSNEKSRIAVYSSDGRLILKKFSNSATCEIDFSKQTSGIYLLSVNRQIIRIVKK